MLTNVIFATRNWTMPQAVPARRDFVFLGRFVKEDSVHVDAGLLTSPYSGMLP